MYFCVMNLYTIDFGHWAPKGGARGILGYVLAPDDKAVLDYILSEPHIKINENITESVHTTWKYELENSEEEQIECWGEPYYDRLLRTRGQLWDEDNEDAFTDLYYGLTLTGWTLIEENVDHECQRVLLAHGLAKQLQ